MKYTKGPWKVCYDGNIDSESGRSICALGFSTYKEYNDQPEMKANARLIASAPELLEACKAIIKVSEKASNGKGYDNEPNIWLEHIQALKLIRQAIAKAEHTP